MRRRSFVRLLATSLSVFPVRPWRVWAQTVTFPGSEADALDALAQIVLPGSIGAQAVLKLSHDFTQWVQDYRPGADTEHGYGHTRVVPLPASPAPVYLKQLERLKPALLSGDREKARTAVLDCLGQDEVRDLTPIPRGKNIVADLMSFYFHSSAAADLCYQAAIERYQCRGTEHSDVAPRAIPKRS